MSFITATESQLGHKASGIGLAGHKIKWKGTAGVLVELKVYLSREHSRKPSQGLVQPGQCSGVQAGETFPDHMASSHPTPKVWGAFPERLWRWETSQIERAAKAQAEDRALVPAK